MLKNLSAMQWWKLLSCVWLWPLCSPWNSPGQNTGVGSHSLLQGIFATQGSNPHCGQILYQLSHQRGSRILEWVAYPFFSGSSRPGIKLDLLHCRQILYQLSYEGSPQCRRLGFNSWVGKIPGEGNGRPLQYSPWRIPWTEEPGRLQSTGTQRVRHDWVTNTTLLLNHSFILPIKELLFLFNLVLNVWS